MFRATDKDDLRETTDLSTDDGIGLLCSFVYTYMDIGILYWPV